MTALLTADEAARLTLGVNVIVRPGEYDLAALACGNEGQYVAPQDWVALTGPCPCVKLTGKPGWTLAPGFKQIKPCRDCRDGRQIVPLYVECLKCEGRGVSKAGPRCSVECEPWGLVLVGRGAIEVVPVVEGWEHPPSLDESPKCLVFAPPYAILELVRDYMPLILAFGDERLKLPVLDPLPVPGRDFGIVIDCVEVV